MTDPVMGPISPSSSIAPGTSQPTMQAAAQYAESSTVPGPRESLEDGIQREQARKAREQDIRTREERLKNLLISYGVSPTPEAMSQYGFKRAPPPAAKPIMSMPGIPARPSIAPWELSFSQWKAEEDVRYEELAKTFGLGQSRAWQQSKYDVFNIFRTKELTPGTKEWYENQKRVREQQARENYAGAVPPKVGPLTYVPPKYTQEMYLKAIKEKEAQAKANTEKAAKERQAEFVKQWGITGSLGRQQMLIEAGYSAEEARIIAHREATREGLIGGDIKLFAGAKKGAETPAGLFDPFPETPTYKWFKDIGVVEAFKNAPVFSEIFRFGEVTRKGIIAQRAAEVTTEAAAQGKIELVWNPQKGIAEYQFTGKATPEDITRIVVAAKTAEVFETERQAKIQSYLARPPAAFYTLFRGSQMLHEGGQYVAGKLEGGLEYLFTGAAKAVPLPQTPIGDFLHGTFVKAPPMIISVASGLPYGAVIMSASVAQHPEGFLPMAAYGMWSQTQAFVEKPAEFTGMIMGPAILSYAATKGPIALGSVQTPLPEIIDPLTNLPKSTSPTGSVYVKGLFYQDLFAEMEWQGKRPIGGMVLGQTVNVAGEKTGTVLRGFVGEPSEAFRNIPLPQNYRPGTPAEWAFVEPVMMSRLSPESLDLYLASKGVLEVAHSPLWEPPQQRELFGARGPSTLAPRAFDEYLRLTEEEARQGISSPYGSIVMRARFGSAVRSTLGDLDKSVVDIHIWESSEAARTVIEAEQPIGPLRSMGSQLSHGRVIAAAGDQANMIDFHTWDTRPGIFARSLGIGVIPEPLETIHGETIPAMSHRGILWGKAEFLEYRETVPGVSAEVAPFKERFKDIVDIAGMSRSMAADLSTPSGDFYRDYYEMGVKQRLAARSEIAADIFERYALSNYPESQPLLAEMVNPIPAARAAARYAAGPTYTGFMEGLISRYGYTGLSSRIGTATMLTGAGAVAMLPGKLPFLVGGVLAEGRGLPTMIGSKILNILGERDISYARAGGLEDIIGQPEEREIPKGLYTEVSPAAVRSAGSEKYGTAARTPRGVEAVGDIYQAGGYKRSLAYGSISAAVLGGFGYSGVGYLRNQGAYKGYLPYLERTTYNKPSYPRYPNEPAQYIPPYPAVYPPSSYGYPPSSYGGAVPVPGYTSTPYQPTGYTPTGYTPTGYTPPPTTPYQGAYTSTGYAGAPIITKPPRVPLILSPTTPEWMRRRRAYPASYIDVITSMASAQRALYSIKDPLEGTLKARKNLWIQKYEEGWQYAPGELRQQFPLQKARGGARVQPSAFGLFKYSGPRAHGGTGGTGLFMGTHGFERFLQQPIRTRPYRQEARAKWRVIPHA